MHEIEILKDLVVVLGAAAELRPAEILGALGVLAGTALLTGLWLAGPGRRESVSAVVKPVLGGYRPRGGVRGHGDVTSAGSGLASHIRATQVKSFGARWRMSSAGVGMLIGSVGMAIWGGPRRKVTFILLCGLVISGIAVVAGVAVVHVGAAAGGVAAVVGARVVVVAHHRRAHAHAGGVAGFDGLVVVRGASGLDDRADTLVDTDVHTVTEREKSVRCHDRALDFEAGMFSLDTGNAGTVYPTHLAGTNTDGLIVFAVDDGV